MTINVLELVPKVLQYLDNINEPTLFRFCAIPQVMAIATLELVFNNIHVFETNVKIRRGLACKLILLARSRKGVYDVFREYVQRIHDRNVATDPNYLKLEILCGKIEQYIQQHYPKDDNTTLSLSKAHDDSLDSLMILAAAGGFAIATCAIMVGVAYAFGANFSFSLQDAFPFWPIQSSLNVNIFMKKKRHLINSDNNNNYSFVKLAPPVDGICSQFRVS